MEDFISEAKEKLESMMKSMIENENAAESFFKNAMSDTENWRFEVQDSFKSVANGAKVREIAFETRVLFLTFHL
jgi:hypothetical protein